MTALSNKLQYKSESLGFGLCPSSGILKTRRGKNTIFQTLDVFMSSGEVGRHLLCWEFSEY
jgi:hypothetical protein